MAVKEDTHGHAPIRSQSQNFIARISAVLAWMLVGCGIVTALVTAWIVFDTYSPIIAWDQWTIVNDLMESHGHPSWAQLLAPNNEHRIPFGRLAGYADLLLFGGVNISLLIEIYIVQILEALLLIWMFHKFGKHGTLVTRTAAGVFIFCMFYPIQIENFYWGFQISFVLAIFSASVAMAAFVMHAKMIRAADDGSWFSLALAVSLTSAFVAELSLASGLFVWPILLLLGYLLRVPSRTQLLVAATGAIASAAFLWDFRSPGQHAKPLESLEHPLTIIEYVRTYLAWSLDSRVPTGSHWPNFAELLTMLAIVVSFVALLRLARSRPPERGLEMFFAGIIVFVLVNAVVTALGRINLGIAQATSSRYQSFALLFWASLIGLVILRTARHAPVVSPLFTGVQAVLLIAVLATAPRFETSRQAASAHQSNLAQGYIELEKDPSSPEANRRLSPYPNLVQAYSYMRSHHMGPDIQASRVARGSLVPIRASEIAQLKVRRFEIASQSQCLGYIDSVDPVPGKYKVRVTGWAWNLAGAKAPSRVLLVLQDGTVTGSADVSLPRSDVQAKISAVTTSQTGWTGIAELPLGSILRAFIVLDDARSACPLANEFALPR